MHLWFAPMVCAAISFLEAAWMLIETVFGNWERYDGWYTQRAADKSEQAKDLKIVEQRSANTS